MDFFEPQRRLQRRQAFVCSILRQTMQVHMQGLPLCMSNSHATFDFAAYTWIFILCIHPAYANYLPSNCYKKKLSVAPLGYLCKCWQNVVEKALHVEQLLL